MTERCTYCGDDTHVSHCHECGRSLTLGLTELCNECYDAKIPATDKEEPTAPGNPHPSTERDIPVWTGKGPGYPIRMPRPGVSPSDHGAIRIPPLPSLGPLAWPVLTYDPADFDLPATDDDAGDCSTSDASEAEPIVAKATFKELMAELRANECEVLYFDQPAYAHAS